MNFIKIEGNCLTVTDTMVLDDETIEVSGEYAMDEMFGTDEVVSLENQDTGGGCMVDVIHLSNGKSVCVSDELIGIYPNAKAFYDGWVTQELIDNDIVEYIDWYEDAKTEVQNLDLMWCKVKGGILTTKDNNNVYEDTFNMKEKFGAAVVIKHYNEHPGVDILVLSNRKVLSINLDSLVLHTNEDKFYEYFGEGNGDQSELSIDINDGGSAWTKQHKIDTLVGIFDDWQLNPTDISGDHDLWEKCIHEHMNDTGVLDIPFTSSFDDYFEWDTVECNHHKFNAWLKSIAYAIGWRRYTRIDDRITVPGLCTLVVATDLLDGKVWLDEVQILANGGKGMFDCGVNLWYDFLPTLALETNIDHEQLQYCMASVNALDKVYYDNERWMPHTIQRAIKLAIAEGFTLEEAADASFMEDKYQIWLDNNLI